VRVDGVRRTWATFDRLDHWARSVLTFPLLPCPLPAEKEPMNGFTLPFTLLLSFFLAVLALVINQVSPAAAALVGAIAALIFIKLLIFGS
jgi:hypothetical protein